MNQYNEISTLQYMGSKARIISHICDPIMKNKSIQTVVDLSSMDYRRFLHTILPNTVNLLLTDPPYGDNAQYFEHAQRIHLELNAFPLRKNPKKSNGRSYSNSWKLLVPKGQLMYLS